MTVRADAGPDGLRGRNVRGRISPGQGSRDRWKASPSVDGIVAADHRAVGDPRLSRAVLCARRWRSRAGSAPRCWPTIFAPAGEPLVQGTARRGRVPGRQLRAFDHRGLRGGLRDRPDRDRRSSRRSSPRRVQRSALGGLDQALGFLFGVARGILLVAVAFIVYDRAVATSTIADDRQFALGQGLRQLPGADRPEHPRRRAGLDRRALRRPDQCLRARGSAPAAPAAPRRRCTGGARPRRPVTATDRPLAHRGVTAPRLRCRKLHEATSCHRIRRPAMRPFPLPPLR